MDNTDLAGLLLLTLVGLLVFCLVTDLRQRKIYNKANATIALLAPAYWFVTGQPVWPDMAIHLATALAVLLLFAICFRFGVMGGGDVKLLAALALWFHPLETIELIFFTSVFGLVITLLFWIEHRRSGRPGSPRIPYGIAITLAALWVIGEPYFNHFV